MQTADSVQTVPGGTEAARESLGGKEGLVVGARGDAAAPTGAGSGVIALDADQQYAAQCLRQVARRLDSRWHRRPRGVYLHGRPGRGKTMLMDDFFAQVASEHKRRYHFHGFFASLHRAVGAGGGLPAAVDAVLGGAELICFDEFHVHDIGDAMLLDRLLRTLVDRRITLVATSNYPPENLLPNPLVHAKFEPTIDLLRDHLDVVSVDGAQDYRLLTTDRAGFTAGSYVIGDCGAHDGPVHANGCGEQGITGVAIAHTMLSARRADDELVIDFAEICAKPLSSGDCVTLARTYPRWTVCAVPPLRSVPLDWATRFVDLIDVLYDADLELTLHAHIPLADLLADAPGVRDLDRIASRLRQLDGASSNRR